MAHSYPQFSDGDVEIHLTTSDDKLILHSYVLALHSPWFKASLSEHWSNSGTDKTSSIIGGSGSTLTGGTGTVGSSKPRWIYELRFDENNALGMLTKQSSTPRKTEMIAANRGKVAQSTAGSKAANRLQANRLGSVKAHQDMLGTLYHLAPAFSHESFEKAKASILLLANAADIYGCQHVCKLHIESHLRLYRAEVLELCATKPLGMLELAMAVRSEWIFMEAGTNLIGRSKGFFEGAQLQMADLKIAELMSRKRLEFFRSLVAAEFEMFRMQPTSMADWTSVAAINFFRQWLSERLRDGQGSQLGSGYGNLYHAICDTSPAAKACRKSKVLAWNSVLITNAADTMDTLMPFVDTVFADAARIVASLRKDITRRQEKRVDLHRALTFVGIGDDELPWVKK